MDMLESLGLELAIHRDLDVLVKWLFYDIIQSVGQNNFEISVDCDQICRYLHNQKDVDSLYKPP